MRPLLSRVPTHRLMGEAMLKPDAQGLPTGRGPLLPILVLASVSTLVSLVASRLSRHADAIANETEAGGVWIGTIMLAAATSLPEVLTER